MATTLLELIRNIAPLLYIIGGGLLLWGMSRFMKARNRLSSAQFQLERENAAEQGGQSITLAIVALQGVVLVFLLSTTTYNAWQTFSGIATPTPARAEAFRTAIPVEGGEAFVVPTREEEGLIIPRTPAPSPTPAGTILPGDPSVGCIADQANLVLPANGQVIYEVETILGTANIQDFAYYRFEIRNIETDPQFGVIGGPTSDRTEPVINGPLGSIVPQNFAPGEYRFRLVVFDVGGQMRAFCEITIFISDPPPTPTPIGGEPVPVPLPEDNTGDGA